MAITEKQRYHLKKLVKELEQYRGRHTELVSVYVPQGYDLNKIINHLSQEQGTATNIKSTSTRKNVIDALEKMIQHLRLYKKTPENGLAVFSGNVSEKEGGSDVQVWAIEPPLPLNIRIYRCDKTFVTEHLADMTETKECYGLVVLDRRDANLALLKGKTIVPVSKTHSPVPGKMRAGGQSAPRFQRLREGAVKDHLKKVADLMKEEFLSQEQLKGIIIGGPGPTKNKFIDDGYLTGGLQEKIIAIKDLSYTGDFGVQELLDRSEEVLANEDIADEKKVMNQFFRLLSTEPEKVSYGKADVLNKLNMGAVDIVLISESVDDEIIEEFEEAAKELGTEIRIISTETREGVQLRDMGKIAAILRYNVE